MTMPIERTRSLRWMWEFLVQLNSNLRLVSEATTASMREVTEKIESILRHYPTPQEIVDWARDEEMQFTVGRFLETEPESDATTQKVWKRGVTSPAQRAEAMAQAYELVQFGLSGSGLLSERMKTQKTYVLRHYPDPQTMASWIRCERSRISEVPGYSGWLS